MTVKSLRLRNFRNYGQQYVEFSDMVNIICGDNAQGKTNILEAVFLCSTGRSHRTQKDSELIKFGEDAAKIEIEFERKNYGVFRIEIEILRSGGKSIAVNGVPLRRAGDLLGRLNSVIFSPEDLAIIKSEPQVRRRFLDMFISQIKPAYYFNLHSYLSALRQRNTLLRQAREKPGLLDTIGAWDAQLADYGSKVIWERQYFIRLICEYAKINHAMITGGTEDLTVTYGPSLKTGDFEIPPDPTGDFSETSGDFFGRVGVFSGLSFGGDRPGEEKNLRDAFAGVLERCLQNDIMRASTQYGPHKDDISCSVGGKNIRLYGSQGQQRTAALSLKMAQVDVMVRETGDNPVLLLDDVMSELDRGRQDNISQNMKNAQLFLTGTDINAPAGADSRFFRVESGRISLTPA
jgi:DNA replication and repair protein RecF